MNLKVRMNVWMKCNVIQQWLMGKNNFIRLDCYIKKIYRYMSQQQQEVKKKVDQAKITLQDGKLQQLSQNRQKNELTQHNIKGNQQDDFGNEDKVDCQHVTKEQVVNRDNGYKEDRNSERNQLFSVQNKKELSQEEEQGQKQQRNSQYQSDYQHYQHEQSHSFSKQQQPQPQQKQQQKQQPQISKQVQKEIQNQNQAQQQHIKSNNHHIKQQQQQYSQHQSSLSQQHHQLSAQAQTHHHLPVPISQYDKLYQQLTKYLIIAYYSYVIDHHASTNNIFDKNQIFKKPHLDMTLFLKFYKDFQIKDIYKVGQIIQIFKRQAINRLWIDATLLIKVIITVVQYKSQDNFTEPQLVTDQSQRIERLRKLLNLFDKQKVKNHLKSKQLWQEILLLYSQRDTIEKTVQKDHQNKSHVVGQFLERNFDKQVPKWLEKKEKQPHIMESKMVKKNPNNNLNNNKLNNNNLNNHSKKSLTEQFSKINNNNDKKKKKRDQKAISNSIQRLRTKSEKSISNLKKLISKDFSIGKDIKQLIAKKSETTDRSKNYQIIQNTPSSVKKQIENYLISENSRLLKSQNSVLMRDLNLKDDEPFLRQYFQSEVNDSNKNVRYKDNLILSQKRNLKQNKVSLQKSDKNNQYHERRVNNNYLNSNNNNNNYKSKQQVQQCSVSKLPKIQTPYTQLSSPQPQLNRRKEALSLQQHSRKYENVRSQPSHRQQKVTKIEQKEQSRSQSVKKLDGKEQNRLSEKELIQKKVYEYLAKNKEQQIVLGSVNSGGKQSKLILNRDYRNKISPVRLEKNINLINSSLQPQQIKKSLLLNQINASSSNLLKSERQQVYELWRNFI